MLGFGIGQRESGFYSGRTESQTDRQNHTAIQYRISISIILYIYVMKTLIPTGVSFSDSRGNFFQSDCKYPKFVLVMDRYRRHQGSLIKPPPPPLSCKSLHIEALVFYEGQSMDHRHGSVLTRHDSDEIHRATGN